MRKSVKIGAGRRGVVMRGTANLPSHARIAAFAQAERMRGAFVGSTLPPSTILFAPNRTNSWGI